MPVFQKLHSSKRELQRLALGSPVVLTQLFHLQKLDQPLVKRLIVDGDILSAPDPSRDFPSHQLNIVAIEELNNVAHRR